METAGVLGLRLCQFPLYVPPLVIVIGPDQVIVDGAVGWTAVIVPPVVEDGGSTAGLSIVGQQKVEIIGVDGAVCVEIAGRPGLAGGLAVMGEQGVEVDDVDRAVEVGVAHQGKRR